MHDEEEAALPAAKFKGTLVRDQAEAVRMIQDATEAGEWLAIDLETTGLSPWRDKAVVVGIYREATKQAAVLHYPPRFGDSDWHDDWRLPVELTDALSDPGCKWMAHNMIGFDFYFLHEAGVDIFAGDRFDTLVAEGVCVKAARRDVRRSLAHAYRRRLGQDLKESIHHETWRKPVLTEEQLSYVAADIVHLPRLKRAQEKEIEGDTRKRAMAMEQRLLKPVAAMTINGLPVDPEALSAYVINVGSWQTEALQVAREDASMPDLNPGSPTQVKQAFANLECPIANTQAATLAIIHQEHEVEAVRNLASSVLAARVSAKRNNFYDLEWIGQHVTDGPDGPVVRPRYWQVGTDTGRFSCSDPNLQQVSADCRTFFGAVPDAWCITADYTALEIVIAGWLSKDEALLEACRSSDVHRAMASKLYGVSAEEVTPQQRRFSKAGTFTFLFGGTAELLYQNARAQGSKITRKETIEFEALFFETFFMLGKARYNANMAAKYKNYVSITMPNGLIRHLAGETLKGTTLMNTSVQGGAAAGLKATMLELWEQGYVRREQGREVSQRGTVHDELVFTSHHREESVAVARAAEIQRIMVEGMQSMFPGLVGGQRIPIRAEVHVGRPWKGEPPFKSLKDLMARNKYSLNS